MEFKTSELLKKYWETESSLQEEKELKSALQSSENTELEEEKALFAYFEQQKEKTLDDSFDEEFLSRLEVLEENDKKVISLTGYFGQYAKIAAAVVVLFVSGLLYHQQQQQYTTTDTFEDPELAYAELKKQLLIVSQYLNKGQKTVEELNNLSKVPESLEDLGKLSGASEGLDLLSEMNVENN